MKGLNEFISVAIVLSISIVTIVFSLEFVKPLINKVYDNFVLNEGINNLSKISRIIKDLSKEGEGSKKTIEIKVSRGYYVFDNITDTINFTFITSSDLSVSGIKNDINITTYGNMVKMSLKPEGIDFVNKVYISTGSTTLIFDYYNFDENVVKISIST